MNVYKLIIGTLILVAGYIFYHPGTATLMQIYEAIVYTLVILVAFQVKKPLLFILIPLIMACINLGIGVLGLVIEPLLDSMLDPMVIADNKVSFVFTNKLSSAMTVAILAAIGALIFCFILDYKDISNNFTKKSYILIPFLCSFSAIPLYIFYKEDWSVIAHKIIWFVMFSLGLYISERNSTDEVSKNAQSI